MSSHFRKTWLKPEVYPLIGAMGAAIGICGYAIYNKTRCTTVSWNKSRRMSDAAVNYKDELVPVLASVRGKSTSIFGTDRAIFENAYAPKNQSEEVLKFTVRVGEEEEEEEEEAVEEEVAAPPPAEEEPAPEPAEVKPDPTPAPPADPIAEVKTESPEEIQAALDKALNVLKAEESEPKPASA